MNSRSQLAKLRKDLGAVQTNDEVRAISRLMDELSAEAAGGSCIRGEVSLLEIMGEAPDQNRPNHGQTIKR
jgi:hypothetical protein